MAEGSAAVVVVAAAAAAAMVAGPCSEAEAPHSGSMWVDEGHTTDERIRGALTQRLREGLDTDDVAICMFIVVR